MTKVVDEYRRVGVYNGNQSSPKGEAPEWRTYSLCDSTGFEVDNSSSTSPRAGTLTLEAVEPVAIAEIRQFP